MYAIKGKLDDGQSFSGVVPGTDAADALGKVIKNLPAGRTLASVSVKRQAATGTVKFRKATPAKATSAKKK